jgi:hypothetical protein
MSDLIELSELRISNILLYKGELHYVSHLSMDIDDEYQDTIGVTPLGKSTGERADWNRALVNNLKRVPLTEEILLSSGFVKSNTQAIMPDGESLIKYGVLFEKDDLYITLFKGVFEYSIKTFDGGSSWEWEFVTTLEFFHQAQNLFHALKGYELKIK